MTDDDGVLKVGDIMQMSVALVDTMKADPRDDSLPVRVKRIDRDPGSGLVTLWLENVEPVAGRPRGA